MTTSSFDPTLSYDEQHCVMTFLVKSLGHTMLIFEGSNLVPESAGNSNVFACDFMSLAGAIACADSETEIIRALRELFREIVPDLVSYLNLPLRFGAIYGVLGQQIVRDRLNHVADFAAASSGRASGVFFDFLGVSHGVIRTSHPQLDGIRYSEAPEVKQEYLLVRSWEATRHNGERSISWVASRAEIDRIITDIKTEQRRMAEQPHLFSMAGINGLPWARNGINCMNWAMTQLSRIDNPICREDIDEARRSGNSWRALGFANPDDVFTVLQNRKEQRDAAQQSPGAQRRLA